MVNEINGAVVKCAQGRFYIFLMAVHVEMGAEESTLCEKLEGPDFLPDAKLQDLLQDVLPLDLLHDAHPLQLSVSQPHQSPP